MHKKKHMVHILLINKLAFPIQQVTAGKKNKRATTKIHRCMSVCGFVFFLCVYEFQQRTDFCNDLYDKKQIVKKKKKSRQHSSLQCCTVCQKLKKNMKQWVTVVTEAKVQTCHHS